MAAYQLRMCKKRREDDDELLMAGAVWYLYVNRQRSYERSIWTREWLRRRSDLGAFDTLLSELREEDKSSFLNFLRVSPGLFDDLLEKITPLIERQDTSYRPAISPEIRLAITMRYLATGICSFSYLLLTLKYCTCGIINSCLNFFILLTLYNLHKTMPFRNPAYLNSLSAQ